MHTSHQFATRPQPPFADRNVRPRKTEDLAYQTVTVAAILLVLGSVWLF